MMLLSVVKETNTWLSMNTLIKRGKYSAVQSNTHLEVNGLIILYRGSKTIVNFLISVRISYQQRNNKSVIINYHCNFCAKLTRVMEL